MSSGQSQHLYIARDLACFRGGRMLFAKLSFTMAAGQAMWLRGPNAIGKSSLIRIIAGLLPPLSGTQHCEGKIALLDDRPVLDQDANVAKALAFWAALDGGSSTIAGAMTAMGIAHLADVPVRFLSQGQRKRAGMARIIASGAPLWLLDEPANGLDDAGIECLRAAIAAQCASGGAVILASHIDLNLPQCRAILISDFALRAEEREDWAA
jgi:heme exporter protein A